MVFIIFFSVFAYNVARFVWFMFINTIPTLAFYITIMINFNDGFMARIVQLKGREIKDLDNITHEFFLKAICPQCPNNIKNDEECRIIQVEINEKGINAYCFSQKRIIIEAS